MLQVGRTWDRSQAATPGIYSVAADISVCPGVDSASKNEYQDIPGGKGGWCVMVTTLPPSCAECLVIWSLNRPEPSGPHRSVIGVALNFSFFKTTIPLLQYQPYKKYVKKSTWMLLLKSSTVTKQLNWVFNSMTHIQEISTKFLKP